MPDPMTQDQLLGILSPCFHAAFIDICRHRVYVGESIFYAAGLTVNQDDISSRDWGFVILLDRRYLRVTISEGYGPSYFTTKLGKQKINRQWVMTDLSKKDSFPLPSKAKSRWDVRVVDQQYNEIKGISHNDYEVKDKRGDAIQLVELRFEFQNRAGDWYKAFKAQDGNHILQLLNTAMQCGGKLVIEPVAGSTDGGASEIVKLIGALGELRKANLLTEQEFEEKKQQLLARL